MNSHDKSDAGNKEAEMAVLGAMMLAPEKIGPLVMARLTDKDFRVPAHQVIFREIAAVIDVTGKVDLITLTQHLREKDMLNEIGGPTYLSDLIACVTTMKVGHYIDELTRLRLP